MSITRRKDPLAAEALPGTSSLPIKVPADAQQAITDTTGGMFSLLDFEEDARKKMPTQAYEYLASGAADELTLRWNRESFEKIRLRPRVLVDISKLDTRVNLFGQCLPFPILLAPTGL